MAPLKVRNFIAGQWEAVATQLDSCLCNASTGTVIDHQQESSESQLRRVVELADHACATGSGWCALDASARAKLLRAAATELSKEANSIAELDSLCTGVVISLTRSLAGICSAAFMGAAAILEQDTPHTREEALLIERQPLGPAAIIGPWNAPAGIVSHKLASALAAGCPTILKPSEWAPYSADRIVAALQRAGFPDDACQLLHGTATTGAALVSHPRIAAVSFTGGLLGGQAIARACAEQIKPAQLELGGNNPLVVLQDADVEAAADGVFAAMTTLNGQWCRALGRLLVHESLHDELLSLVAQRFETLPIGDSLSDDSKMGPLVHEQHRQLVQEKLDALLALGGKAHSCSTLPALDGWFFAPTLVTGLDSSHSVEEIFGPVACVHSFASDEEAVRLANETPFGLAAYVFGETEHCWDIARQIRTGLTKINAVTLLNMSPTAPRPAWGLSGLGDEGTLETFEFFRGTRVIGVP